MSSLTATIDWLSFTIKGDWSSETFKEEKYHAFFNRIAPVAGRVQTTARFGYDTAFTCNTGVIALYHSRRADMGAHYILSGSVLKGFYESGLSPFKILEFVVSIRAKVTRIDIAKDLTNLQVNIENIWCMAKRGESTGTSQTVRNVTDNRGGYTMYIGSRESEKFARLYNKAAEQGVDGDWWRFEVELKGDAAKMAARLILADVEASGAIFDGIAFGMLSLEDPTYNAFRGEKVPIGLPKVERTPDTELWIEKQVIPAVLSFLDIKPDSEVVKSLVRLVYAKWRDKEIKSPGPNDSTAP